MAVRGDRVRIGKGWGASYAQGVSSSLTLTLTPCARAQDGLWEEAELLRAREVGMTAGGAGGAEGPGAGPPRVDVADIEAVVSAWTGIDVQRLGQDEKSRLLQLAAVLEARGTAALSWRPACLMEPGPALYSSGAGCASRPARMAAAARLAPAGARAVGKGSNMACVHADVSLCAFRGTQCSAAAGRARMVL